VNSHVGLLRFRISREVVLNTALRCRAWCDIIANRLDRSAHAPTRSFLHGVSVQASTSSPDVINLKCGPRSMGDSGVALTMSPARVGHVTSSNV